MKVPLGWLRELAPSVPVDAAAVGEAITLLGVELDVIETPPPFPSGVVAARVLEKSDIEGARACRVAVDAGPRGRHEVVCGAHNFAPGDLLPLALPGARLTNGLEISRREVRLPRGPVVSDGMLCAPDELGLSSDHSGILHLESGQPGDDVRPLLGLGETVLVFEVNPNRPDVMSMVGMAREAVAAFGGPLVVPRPEAELPEATFPIEIEDPSLCPRYVAVVVEGVAIGPSPPEIAGRLRAAGMRPINNVVDATNYVLLERGQPLHAFDLDRLAGPRIVVRLARADEELVTLDGVTRRLQPPDLVIADADRAVGLAGVMGGASSEVTASTSRILVESACFAPASVLVTSKRLGLRTEASARFERGVDPELTVEAAHRAADLIVAWAGGKVTAVTDARPVPFERRRVRVRADKVNRLLGTALAADQQQDFLARVDIPTRAWEGGYEVEVPGRIPDMTSESHVAEEIGRLYGYNRITRTLPASPEKIGGLSFVQRRRRLLRDALMGMGCTEVVTWSFASAEELEGCGLTDRSAVRVLNPLHAEQSLLRPSVLPGLLRAARHNAGRRRADLALFEMGIVFEADDTLLPLEHLELGILLAGQAETSGPHGPARGVDVFDVKGMIEELADVMGVGALAVERADVPGLHPGQAGRLLLDGAPVGRLGALHPAVAEWAELPEGAVVAVVDAGELLGDEATPTLYAELPRFPEADRDLDVVVPEDLPVGDLVAAVREAGGNLLRRAAVVDVYRGRQVGEERKSITLSLAFGDAERTLTDVEVTVSVDAIVTHVARVFGGILRGH